MANFAVFGDERERVLPIVPTNAPASDRILGGRPCTWRVMKREKMRLTLERIPRRHQHDAPIDAIWRRGLNVPPNRCGLVIIIVTVIL